MFDKLTLIGQRLCNVR